MTDSDRKRLNKFISETGLCSRREADALIEAGKVEINGHIAQMGEQVSDSDQIRVNGKPLRGKPAPVYLAYNKPVGVTCTTERKIRSNIVDAVGYPERIFPIGRLDRPSEGLILLTNDGDIVNKILRAGNQHEKEYIVTLAERFDDEFVRRMSSGVPVLEQITKPCRVERLTARTFRIILTQGLNRQIRRMAEYLGHEVVKLKRVRIMHIELGDLTSGQYRKLAGKELATLEKALTYSVKTQEASEPATPRVEPRRVQEQRKPAVKQGKKAFRSRKR